MKRCYNCQKDLEFKEAPGLADTCRHCGAALRACFNCRHYSPDASQQCLIPAVALLKDKRSPNSCPEFRFREIFSQRKDSHQENSKRKWDDLFKL